MNNSIDEAGYGKIEGETIHQIITCLKVVLGRDKLNAEDSITSDEQLILLGHNQKISRRHLFLYYDHEKHEWYAENLSKNVVYINKNTLSKNDPPQCISPISAIQIDDVKFYFFQSKEE